MANILSDFDIGTAYDIGELIPKIDLSGKYIILVSEYEYGLISTKFFIVEKIDDCIAFLKRRYKKFNKEKDDYKYIEENYFEDESCMRIMSSYGPDKNNNIFASNIRFFGINMEEYNTIKETAVKIFGKFVFDVLNF